MAQRRVRLASREENFEIATKALDRTRRQLAKKYNGVDGRLPAWVPPIFHHFFEAARTRLLSRQGITSKIALQWIDNYSDRDAAQNGGDGEFGFRGVRPIPPEYLADVEILYWLRKAVQLEHAKEDAGFEYLLGPRSTVVLHAAAAVAESAVREQQTNAFRRALGTETVKLKAKERKQFAREKAVPLYRDRPGSKQWDIASELQRLYPKELGGLKLDTVDRYLDKLECEGKPSRGKRGRKTLGEG